jgi:hypothetical protein
MVSRFKGVSLKMPGAQKQVDRATSSFPDRWTSNVKSKQWRFNMISDFNNIVNKWHQGWVKEPAAIQHSGVRVPARDECRNAKARRLHNENSRHDAVLGRIREKK